MPGKASGFAPSGRAVHVFEVFDTGENAGFARVRYMDNGEEVILKFSLITRRPRAPFQMHLRSAVA